MRERSTDWARKEYFFAYYHFIIFGCRFFAQSLFLLKFVIQAENVLCCRGTPVIEKFIGLLDVSLILIGQEAKD